MFLRLLRSLHLRENLHKGFFYQNLLHSLFLLHSLLLPLSQNRTGLVLIVEV